MSGTRFRQLTLAFLAVISVVILAGCGSDSREASPPPPTASATDVGVNVCINCHSNQKDAWLTSRHANATASPNYSSVTDTSSCKACHDQLGDGKKLVGVLPNTNPRPLVGCESCHGPGSLHYGLGPIGPWRATANSIGSAQFNTCNACHQLLDASGNKGTPFHSGTDRRIVDTHYAEPGNWPGGTGGNTKDIAGYALLYKNDNTCSACHNAHNGNLVPNREWAQSAHADKKAAGAWAYYNWSLASRANCQRCHTTTGAIAFITSLQNKTAYTPPLTPNDAWKPEMLQCSGCHTNMNGGIRNPGAYTAQYSNGATYAFPNASGSNLCLTCHTGRESGDSIKSSTANFANTNFLNSHYLTAGGTVYTASGYEFTGRDYTNPSFYAHDRIGTSSAAGTGINGACVGCHMTSPEKHKFMPVAKNAAGQITAISSSVCATCHTGQFTLTPAELGEQEELVHDALAALDVELQNRGYFFYEANPYFFTAPYVVGGTNTRVTNWLSGSAADTGKPNMGAAFNFNLIKHDPGAYAHNRYYIKRLIYDSIDWLDDNVLNNSVQATLDGSRHAGKPYQAKAKQYVLSASGGRP